MKTINVIVTEPGSDFFTYAMDGTDFANGKLKDVLDGMDLPRVILGERDTEFHSIIDTDLAHFYAGATPENYRKRISGIVGAHMRNKNSITIIDSLELPLMDLYKSYGKREDYEVNVFALKESGIVFTDL